MIIFENKDILILYKPNGIPGVPDKSCESSLLTTTEKEKKTTLFPVNRIDRPAAGLILFAKHRSAAAYYSAQLRSESTEKTYLAFVPEISGEPRQKIIHYLKHDTRLKKAIVHNNAEPGFKKSSLSLQVLGNATNYQLIAVRLDSGRFHQIRAQLAAIGSPIKGDVKYGARRKNPDRSIHLLAYKLKIILEGEKEARIFVSPFPKDPLWDFAQTLI